MGILDLYQEEIKNVFFLQNKKKLTVYVDKIKKT